eukprot:98634-Chlamydomonas_euryale.AAC.6
MRSGSHACSQHKPTRCHGQPSQPCRLESTTLRPTCAFVFLPANQRDSVPTLCLPKSTPLIQPESHRASPPPPRYFHNTPNARLPGGRAERPRVGLAGAI